MGAFLERPGAILILALPLVLLEAALGTDENTGGWDRTEYAVLLLYGFLVAAKPRVERSMRRHRVTALAVGAAAFVGVVVWGALLLDSDIDPFTDGGAAVGWRALKGFAGWMWIVAILGFAGSAIARRRAGTDGWSPRVLGGGSARQTRVHRVARYANEGVLPFYVLHEPVIVGIALLVVRWDAGILIRYLVLVIASLLVTLGLYEFGVRRTRITRFLFGMKPPRDEMWRAEALEDTPRGRDRATGDDVLRDGACRPPLEVGS